MEEQTSWKNHTFTLAIFGGIVVLCSIFFVLGMLVGRTQGERIATLAAATLEEGDSKLEDREVRPDLTFFDSTGKGSQEPLQPPLSPQPSTRAAAPAARPDSAAAPATVINLQIAALRSGPDAEKLMSELETKGFHAFILAPAPGDPNPFYRVQVGPFADSIQAESNRLKLVAAGYSPIVRK